MGTFKLCFLEVSHFSPGPNLYPWGNYGTRPIITQTVSHNYPKVEGNYGTLLT